MWTKSSRVPLKREKIIDLAFLTKSLKGTAVASRASPS